VPSVAWFTNWEAQYGVATVSKASLQNDKRAESYTYGSATQHFADLDEMLAFVGFLVEKGPQKGYIKKESKSTPLESCASVLSQVDTHCTFPLIRA
jgi:hypothetical protein